MANHKKASIYNVEKIPYRDLTGEENADYKVIKKVSPIKKQVDHLNGTTWTCECKLCGRHKNISGRLIVKGGYKDCVCITGQTKNEEDGIEKPEVGRGLMYAREHEPEKFMQYLQRREEESQKARHSKYIFEQSRLKSNKNEKS